MIQGTEQGVLVRALHYVNVVEPMSAVLTGMTRHGTFLIRDGMIVNPVRNLRFTQSLLEVFTNVLQVSSETRLVEGVYGVARVPALKVKDFLFTGVSDQ
jgi:predicted Zn-dependent protease